MDAKQIASLLVSGKKLQAQNAMREALDFKRDELLKNAEAYMTRGMFADPLADTRVTDGSEFQAEFAGEDEGIPPDTTPDAAWDEA